MGVKVICPVCDSKEVYSGITIADDPKLTIAIADQNRIFHTCVNGHSFNVSSNNLSE